MNLTAAGLLSVKNPVSHCHQARRSFTRAIALVKHDSLSRVMYVYRKPEVIASKSKVAILTSASVADVSKTVDDDSRFEFGGCGSACHNSVMLVEQLVT